MVYERGELLLGDFRWTVESCGSQVVRGHVLLVGRAAPAQGEHLARVAGAARQAGSGVVPAVGASTRTGKIAPSP
ncbi:hypothetical protein [Streptomyces sp. NPDC006384]|uniref:hypothetical protein n=1 Tax=Streptomyces sp. NPDC006384 TaxID=3364745 RepID=UPI0036D16803